MITQIVTQTPVGETLFTDTSIGNTVDSVKASSATLLYLTVDNTANVQSSYLKLFNLASGSVIVGTTSPDDVIFVAGGAIVTLVYQTKANPGKLFGTALSACCTVTGGTGGTTAPSSNVILTAAYL